MIDKDNLYNQILDGYRTNYDVREIDDGGILTATAHLHIDHGQHVVFKEFEMWSADEDEYAYMFRVGRLTREIAEKIISTAYEDGFPKIKLDHVNFRHQHMRTKLCAIVFCDTADDDALKVIRKCRIYKSFQFSLKGWMEVHTTALCFADGSVTCNRYGRETAKYLKMHVDHYERHVK